MPTIPRSSLRIVLGVALALALAACGGQAAPTSTAPPSAQAGSDGGSGPRDAYAAAICPIFDAIVAVDPRLAEMRAAGAAGEGLDEHAGEIGSLSGELLVILTDLEAVPAWEPGQQLRVQLIGALHAIRAQLLFVTEDIDASDASQRLADLPFIADEEMDRAMNAAAEAGLRCAPSE